MEPDVGGEDGQRIREFNECPVCGRDVLRSSQRHFTRGYLCAGEPRMVPYVRAEGNDRIRELEAKLAMAVEALRGLVEAQYQTPQSTTDEYLKAVRVAQEALHSDSDALERP